MGWLKRAVKKVVRAVKGVVRVVVRIVATVIGLLLGIVDLLLGFVMWPEKKLRLHIIILSDGTGPPIPIDPASLTPVIDPASLTPAIDFARKTLKDRFNVKLLPYGREMIEVMTEPAPPAALNVKCGLGGFGEEFGEAGEFFADHLAGWNGIPIALTFPITVFIVANVSGKGGCSNGPLTDYVTVDPDGVNTASTMAHEIGHACNLWHSGTKSNLMYAESDRGDGAKWFQKNLFRSSRHVMYW